MGAMPSQITGVSIVCSAVCSGADQKKKKTSKFRVTGLYGETGGLPSQRASNAESVSIWWRHYVYNLIWISGIRRLNIRVSYLQTGRSDLSQWLPPRQALNDHIFPTKE